jgi:hypothetical protein
MESYSINSYTTFKTQFSATMIQIEPMLLSDTYEVEIDFVWSTPEIAKGNAAFLKVKYFLEEHLHQAVFTHKSAPMKFVDIDNRVVVFPYVPTSDIIAMTLHSKLNAIADGNIEVVAISIGSKYDATNMTYTYADDSYPALPKLSDWVGTDKYYYKTPWWGRSSPETQDYEVDENTDLTQPPEYDNVLDEIEKVVMGELRLKEDGGEVVNINAWKPEIVKD